MRKTTSGARALLSATAVVAAAGLALTACTSDDSSTPEGGDTSAPAPGDGRRPGDPGPGGGRLRRRSRRGRRGGDS
ncbi:hypothetical protein [Corynebacterium variabile]|uniref:hypothetical protein n=1 Tax=Corynebacterium variabile TaxID=1727 RepID=UPI0011D29CCC|nr:hypothetical protein [Corynebacterium variabile]